MQGPGTTPWVHYPAVHHRVPTVTPLSGNVDQEQEEYTGQGREDYLGRVTRSSLGDSCPGKSSFSRRFLPWEAVLLRGIPAQRDLLS